MYAEEIDENGPDCVRTLDGWEPDVGTVAHVSHNDDLCRAILLTTAAKLVLETSAQSSFPFLFVGRFLVRLNGGILQFPWLVRRVLGTVRAVTKSPFGAEGGARLLFLY